MNANLVIGEPNFVTVSCPVPSTSSTASTVVGFPEGIAVDSGGNLWAADAYNNRVLEFAATLSSGMPATLVIGQSNFTSLSTGTSNTTLDGPTGVAFDSSANLWVADATNNRVLQYAPPFTTNMAATLVLGQANLNTGTADSDPITGTISARTLNTPTSLVFDGSGNLWVSDTVNHRVLQFSPPFTNGMPASLVLGQTDFVSSSANQGGSAGPATLSAPKGMYFNGVTLFIGDTANNRTLGFTNPLINGVNASLVLGQSDFASTAANQGGTTPTATSQSDPFDAGASPIALCVLAMLIAGWMAIRFHGGRKTQPGKE